MDVLQNKLELKTAEVSQLFWVSYYLEKTFPYSNWLFSELL